LIFGLLAAALGYKTYDYMARNHVLDLTQDAEYQREAVNYNNPPPIVGIKKNQALLEQLRNPTFGLAALLGVAFGLAEGIRQGSVGRAIVGAVVGLLAGVGLVYASGFFLPTYWRYLREAAGDPVTISLLLHGTLLLIVGLAAGLAIAAASGNGAGIGNGLAAGLIGGALGTVVYVLIGQLYFQDVNLEQAPAPESGPRLLYCIAPAIAIALIYSIFHGRTRARAQSSAPAQTPAA
jgi:hypothetical protein